MMEQLACDVIKEKSLEVGCSGEPLRLGGVQGGRPTTILVGPNAVPTTKLESLSKDEIVLMMKELDLSDR